jgi:hypothetical protein
MWVAAPIHTFNSAMLLRVRRSLPKKGQTKAQEEEGEHRLATKNRYDASFNIHPSVLDQILPTTTPTNHPKIIHGR